MDEKYTLSPTPAPTVEQQNRAWQGFHNDMNDLIKRYDIPILDGMMIGDGDDPNGEWVRCDDHAAALAEAQATISRLEAALRIARVHVAHSIEDWGVDDETSSAMKEELRVIDAALSPREGEG